MINRLKIKRKVNLQVDEGNDVTNTLFFIYCQIYNDCSVNKLMEVNRLFSFGD